MYTNPNHPPCVVANRLRRTGWKVTGEGKRAVCPTCRTRKPPPKTQPTLMPKKTPPTKPTPPPPTAAPAWKPCPLYVQAQDLLLVALDMDGVTMADVVARTPLSAGTLYRIQAGTRVVRKQTLTQIINELAAFTDTPMKPAIATPLSRDAAREAAKRRRMAYTLLETHYNEEARKYDEGWSDAKIAKECDIAVEFVTTNREDAFGPLGDPRVQALRDQLQALEKKTTEELEELTKFLQSTTDDCVERLKSLRNRIATLETA